MKITSITIHRIENGKLVEKWSEKDLLALLQQIDSGAKLSPPTASVDRRACDTRLRTPLFHRAAALAIHPSSAAPPTLNWS